MKNACIVIRNKRDRLDGEGFEKIIEALLDGGCNADKVFLLSEEDSHEFAQTVIECKNFFDNVLLVAKETLLSSLRTRACELWKVSPAEGPIEADRKALFCLPEGEKGAALVRAEVLPYLYEKHSFRRDKQVVRAVGVPADKLEAVLAEARSRGGGFEYNVQNEDGDIRIEISFDASVSKMQADEVLQLFVSSLNEYVYAIDDTPLARRVYELLKLRSFMLGVAESFTGGGVVSRLIEIPGASEVVYEGIVAYANGSKMRRLGVTAQILEKQGAVSDETAYEMAVGLLERGNCSVAVATTGIAGPASDGTSKPVGLNYIAVGTKESVFVYKYIFKGDRRAITARAINQALFLIYKLIK